MKTKREKLLELAEYFIEEDINFEYKISQVLNALGDGEFLEKLEQKFDFINVDLIDEFYSIVDDSFREDYYYDEYEDIKDSIIHYTQGDIENGY